MCYFLFAPFRFHFILVKFRFLIFSGSSPNAGNSLPGLLEAEKLAGSGGKIRQIPPEEQFLEPRQKNVISLYLVPPLAHFEPFSAKGRFFFFYYLCRNFQVWLLFWVPRPIFLLFSKYTLMKIIFYELLSLVGYGWVDYRLSYFDHT